MRWDSFNNLEPDQAINRLIRFLKRPLVKRISYGKKNLKI